MSFKMHLLALTVAGFAAAAPAHAAIEDSKTGNGELFLTLLDAVGQKSYILDLNVKMNDFLAQANAAAPGATFRTYAADALLTSFLAGVAPASFAAMTYAIGAGDSTGAKATDFSRFIASSNTIDYASTVTNSDLNAFKNTMDPFLGDVNGFIGSGSALSVVITDPSTSGYAGSANWGDNWGGKANFKSTALIGQTVNMHLLSQSSGLFAVTNNPSVYAAIGPMAGGVQYPVYAMLDNSGNLAFSVTPVPEAETYAMMLAGLGLVGFMARRRLNSRVA